MSSEENKQELAPKVEFKDSFLKIVKTVKLFSDEELTRITDACENHGNYEGLINQSFGAMAKRLHEQNAKQMLKAEVALPILTALLTKKEENPAAAVTPDLINESFELAEKFIEKMNAPEAEEK